MDPVTRYPPPPPPRHNAHSMLEISAPAPPRVSGRAARSMISIPRQDKTDQSLGLPSKFQCSVGGGGGGWGESSMLLLCLARLSVRSQVQGSNNAPQVIEIVNSHPPPLVPAPAMNMSGCTPGLRWSLVTRPSQAVSQALKYTLLNNYTC